MLCTTGKATALGQICIAGTCARFSGCSTAKFTAFTDFCLRKFGRQILSENLRFNLKATTMPLYVSPSNPLNASAMVLLLLILLAGCQADPSSSWTPLDLLPYDIPLTIQAPDSAQVNAQKLGPYRDITVRAGRDYAVQILAGATTAPDVGALKSEQADLIRTNTYFERLVREDADGFIYELMIDSVPSYGFVRVHLQDEREYVFRSGLASTFTLEEARRMYRAVKP